MKGFTFYSHGKDYFVKTSKVNKTESLARKILSLLNLPITTDNIDILLFKLCRANCEIKGNERKYYEIYGDNFGGRGSFIDDGYTVIIELD